MRAEMLEQSLLIRPADLLDKTTFLFERFATSSTPSVSLKNIILYVPQLFSITSLHNVTPHHLFYQQANGILTIPFTLRRLLIYPNLDLQNPPKDVEQTPFPLEKGANSLPNSKHGYYMMVEIDYTISICVNCPSCKAIVVGKNEGYVLRQSRGWSGYLGWFLGWGCAQINQQSREICSVEVLNGDFIKQIAVSLSLRLSRIFV